MMEVKLLEVEGGVVSGGDKGGRGDNKGGERKWEDDGGGIAVAWPVVWVIRPGRQIWALEGGVVCFGFGEKEMKERRDRD